MSPSVIPRDAENRWLAALVPVTYPSRCAISSAHIPQPAEPPVFVRTHRRRH